MSLTLRFFLIIRIFSSRARLSGLSKSSDGGSDLKLFLKHEIDANIKGNCTMVFFNVPW